MRDPLPWSMARRRQKEMDYCAPMRAVKVCARVLASCAERAMRKAAWWCCVCVHGSAQGVSCSKRVVVGYGVVWYGSSCGGRWGAAMWFCRYLVLSAIHSQPVPWFQPVAAQIQRIVHVQRDRL